MNDPCLLPHVDFDEGTRSWNVSPAEPDSVAVKSLDGYGVLQSRYHGGLRLATTR